MCKISPLKFKLFYGSKLRYEFVPCGGNKKRRGRATTVETGKRAFPGPRAAGRGLPGPPDISKPSWPSGLTLRLRKVPSHNAHLNVAQLYGRKGKC